MKKVIVLSSSLVLSIVLILGLIYFFAILRDQNPCISVQYLFLNLTLNVSGCAAPNI